MKKGKKEKMCTAATYKTKDSYFGRTLDYEFSYGEQIVIVPRNYAYHFINKGNISSHYALIGMAHVHDNYPLYYEAINEKGVGIAGLNFVGNALYNDIVKEKDNIAQYELIPWILCQCQNIDEVLKLLDTINITNQPYKNMPLASLHWIICDKDRTITLEAVKDGLKIYDNEVGVLTNNPPFDIQMMMLNNYVGLSNETPTNKFAPHVKFSPYSRGMGAIGLPGDLSSQSRFVRVAFVKSHSLSKDDEISSVSQFFHILNSVDQQRGCCKVNDSYEITIYTSCCNLNKGIYYYTTYDNHQINKINMHKEDLNKEELICFPLCNIENFNSQN